MRNQIIITIIVVVAIVIGVHFSWEHIVLPDLFTQLVAGALLLAPFIIIWGIKPLLERLHGDSEFKQQQKIKHSKETLNRIFEHLCSIEPWGENELELSVPVPLHEYYKHHKIEDVLTHDYIPKTLESILEPSEDEPNYTFVPIDDNPMNVKWGLDHLQNNKYSDILSTYTTAQEKYILLNQLSKKHENELGKLIQERITNVFFENERIPEHVKDQIKWMIKHAVMMNYPVHHRDISNVCRITEENIDSKKLHEAITNLLQNDTVISSRTRILEIAQEADKNLSQFKTHLKQLVMHIRDGILVNGKCKGCE